MKVVALLSAVTLTTAEFLRVDNTNAVLEGNPTTEDSQDACEVRCAGSCLQYSWNRKSHHCFLSDSAIWAAAGSDHVQSGCLPHQVSGCGQRPPAPSPPPSKEPVVYTGSYDIDFDLPDGGLRPAIGVQNYQVVRASRLDLGHSDGYGWTYHHSPMMQYWKGSMYVLCNSGPVNEDADEGHVLLMVSEDQGVTWSFPSLLFPTAIVEVNGTAMPTINNQRIGWWTGPSGRLYAMTGYYPESEGHLGEDTLRKWYGYAIREVREDRSLGGVYFIVDNPNLYARESLPFPYYSSATDVTFLSDCEALRGDKKVTMDWWEAIQPQNFDFPKDFIKYSEKKGRSFAKAAAYFHNLDNNTVMLFKKSYAAVSEDEGETWTEPVKLSSLGKGFDKVFAQRTGDGRFGISWTPPHKSAVPNGESPRYPLIVSAGADGATFDVDMLNVNPEVTRRYYGLNKNFGPSNYQRGLLEGNTDSVPGGDMWLAYSMSKEDIWVSRIPQPITGFAAEHVADDFEDMTVGGIVRNWNVFSPQWAPVRIAAAEGGQHLELRDQDPNDFAKAERTFPRSILVAISFRVKPAQADSRLDIDIWSDAKGAHRPVQMWFDYSGQFMVFSKCNYAHGFMPYEAGKWYQVDIEVNVPKGTFSVSLDGKPVLDKDTDLKFCTDTGADAVTSVERLVLRTGVWRGISVAGIDPQGDKLGDKDAAWSIDDVSTRSLPESTALV